MSERHPHAAPPIAIVGMSCRFPGADSCAAFWELLCAGGDAITDIPADRLGLVGYTAPLPATPGRSISRQGGFLQNLSSFDPGLFGISRREALNMDPQQRIVLELAWRALEDASIPSTALRGSRTGVYVGVCYNDFNDLQIQHPPGFDIYRMIGGARSMLCGRISHLLGLAGPSMTLDAACASSLLAVHLAVQSLRCGESELALVAGVNLLLHPLISVGFSQARLLSPDSRCKAFAHGADGFVRSDGAGLVVLKPLGRALRDGDRVYAVLRGSAINNDGVGQGPLMTPSVLGQELVLRAAYADAKVDPAAVSYVEAHGTGTPTGDPVEARALGAVLAPGRQVGCRLGSVKSNLGHTEAAAGIASLIKTALCLHHQMLVPSLHCQTPNPEIPWTALRLTVQQRTEHWPQPAGPRIAGVSSFGINGTNAHVVLSEAAPAPVNAPVSAAMKLLRDRAAPAAAQLLTISAHSPEALQALSGAYKESVSSCATESALAELCAATALRRAHLPYRLAVVCTERSDAVEKLATLASGQSAPLSTRAQVSARPLPLVLVYSGQGSQWPGMARHLYAVSATFRAELLRCADAVAQFSEHSLLTLLLAEPARELTDIDIIQPALFAIQMALTAVLRELGLLPDVVIGHSMGEVAAACVAGALTLTDAARIICQRSRLLQKTSGQGAMAALELSLAETAELLRDGGLTERVAVAVSSSARSTVIAGDPAAVHGVVEGLLQREIFARLIQVNVASHSPQMDALREPLLQALAALQPQPLQTAMISTVTGQALRGPELDAEYWVKNLRQPVLLGPVLDAQLAAGECSLVEVSPHPLLLTAIQQCQQARGREQPALATLRKAEDSWAALLCTIGALHTRGHAVDFLRLFPQGARALPLPPYPFFCEPCQDDQAPTALITTQTTSGGGSDACLGVPMDLAAVAAPRVWQLDRHQEVLRSFAEHRVQGEVVVPGAAMVAWALTAAQRIGRGQYAAEQAEFKHVLFLPAADELKVQLVLSEEAGGARLQVFSAPAEGGAPSSWQLHAQVALRPARLGKMAQYLDLPALQAAPRSRIAGATIYPALARIGLEYGKSYQWLAHADLGAGDALAQLGEPGAAALTAAASWAHGLQPALLDACLQLLVVCAGSHDGNFSLPGRGYLPVSIEAVRLRGDLTRGRIIYAQTRAAESRDAASDGRLTGDVWLLSERGEVLLEVVGVTAQPLHLRPPLSPNWQLAWRPQPLADADAGRKSERARDDTRDSYYLLLGAAGGASDALAAKLQSAGRRCIQVRPGASFVCHSAALFELAPAAAADWEQLEQHLGRDACGPCAAVVYLLGLDSREREELHPHAAQLAAGCLGLLGWLQAHLQRADARLLDGGLLVVTRTARAVTTGAVTRPLQALLWGFAGVVASEHPELGARRIDLDAADPKAVATVLYRELLAKQSAEIVAWRGPQRYVARLVATRHEGPLAVRAVTVRSDATYVVTGGLSGLGVVMAQWLAEQGARRLLLIGRRPPAAAVAAVIAQLRRRGVEVLVGQADVADAAALAQTLLQAESAAWPLRGIIHGAAVLEDSVLSQLRPEQLQRVLAPKVLGALHLQRLTAAAPLDFFVLSSSVAAVLANPGQSSYCAASAFVDSLAESRLARGAPALSIAWGPWAATGLAARGELGERLAARGLPSLSVEEGISALSALLLAGSTTCCPIVAPLEVARWLQATAGASASLLEEVRSEKAPREDSSSKAPAPVSPARAARLRDTIVAAPSAERLALVLDALRELVAKILRATAQQRRQLAAELPLLRLGLDSLMAIELRNLINTELGVSVPLSLIIQNGTLAAIAARVVQELPASAAAAPPAEVWDEGEL